MTASAPAVEVRGLHRSFRKTRPIREVVRRPFRRPERVEALRGVDLDVPEGELFGLLGPNGAGKTTLLKILAGLVLPAAGEARILGVDVRSERALKRLIGMVNGDERSFYWRLTGRENLLFFGRLHGLLGQGLRDRVGELLRRVEMTPDADRRFGDYSSGMKQRMAIARALLRDPPVVLMDEPTRALDPVHAGRVRDFVRDELVGRDRRTVILATHNLREAETLCERVAILARGRVREVGEPAALRRWGLEGRTYRIRVEDGGAPPARSTVVDDAEGQPGRTLDAVVDPSRSLDDLLAEIRAGGGRILDCQPRERDLEEVFGSIVADPGAGEGSR